MEPAMVRFRMTPANGSQCTQMVSENHVLSASKLLMEMIETPSDSCKEIVFKECPSEVFKTIMAHLCGSKISLNDVDFVMEVFHLSKIYQICSLRDLCLTYLSSVKIEISEAVHIYERAVELNISEVQRDCLEVFKAESIRIVTSSEFDRAKPSTVQTILDQCTHLGYLKRSVLAKWGFHECTRKIISGTPENVESCIAGFCRLEELSKIRRMVRSLWDLGLGMSDVSQLSEILNTLLLDNFHIAAISEAGESGQWIDILLKESLSDNDRLQSAFKSDITCKLKVSVLEGDIELTGMVLQLKPKTSSTSRRAVLEELLEVFYSAARQSENPFLLDDQVDWFSGQYLEILLVRSLRVSKGESFEIDIRIEDLEPYRCLTAGGKYHEVYDVVKGIAFSLDFSCNLMRGNESIVPFFIQKVLYNVV